MTANPIFPNLSFFFRCFLRRPVCPFLLFPLWLARSAGAMTETFRNADGGATVTSGRLERGFSTNISTRLRPIVPLVLIGDWENMGCKTLTDLAKEGRFCLFDNFRGVNYSMWREGRQHFRFRIEKC